MSEKKTTAKAITGCVATLFSSSLWCYLLYKILVHIKASESMWFIFWFYLPVTLFVNSILNLIVFLLDDRS